MKGLIHSPAMPFAMRVSRGGLTRGLVLGGVLLCCALMLALAGVRPETCLLPYESILDAASFPGLISLGWLGGMLAMVLLIRRDLFKGGGKYIVMTLPFPRRHVLYSYSLSSILMFLLLWTSLLLSGLLLYSPVSRQCVNVAQEAVVNNLLPADVPLENIIRSNGLFLAFERSDALRLLLPLSPVEVLHSLLLLFGMGLFPAYAAIGETPGINKIFAVAPYLTINHGIIARLPGVGYPLNPWHLGWSFGLLTLAIGFMLFRSIRHLNRDANLL